MSYEGPGTYRHYKGGMYEAIGLALEEATLNRVVVYRPIDGWPAELPEAKYFTRALESFTAMVYIGADGQAAERFCIGDGLLSRGSVGGDSPVACPGCPFCRRNDFMAKPRFEMVSS